MVYFMENPIKMDDLGVPLFLETPIFKENEKHLETTNFCGFYVKLQGCFPFFPFQKKRNQEPHPDVQRTARVDHRILS